jgi:hypothetical protein
MYYLGSNMAIPLQTIKQLAGTSQPNTVQPTSDAQLQGTIAQAQPGQAVTQLAQSIGSQLAGIQASRRNQQASNQFQQIGNIASQGVTTAQLQGNQAIADAQRGLQQYQMQGERQLTAIDRNSKQEIIDARKQFASDQLGLKFTNERQLADYARTQARTEQDFANYASDAQIAMDRKSQLLDISRQRISQQLQLEMDKRNQLLNQSQELATSAVGAQTKQRLTAQANLDIERLNKAGAELDIAIAKQKARTAANQQMWQSIGTVGGAVVGGVVAGVFTEGAGAPAGAAAGAALGGGIGSFIGSSSAGGNS